MEAIRFRFRDRRVIARDRERKARPPRRSLKFVSILNRPRDCVACGCDSGGAGVVVLVVAVVGAVGVDDVEDI